MDKIIAFFNQTDCRDKMLKIIQYGSRFIAWILSKEDEEELEKKFRNLFIITRDSRKMFRMLRTLNELRRMIELFELIKEKKDILENILEVFSRLGFGVFWLSDNISVLSTLKILNYDVKVFNKLAALGWIVGLVFGVCKNMVETYKLQSQNRQKIVKFFKFKLINKLLEIIGRLGDMITASNNLDLTKSLVGKNLNEGWVGIGGLASSIIAIYLIYVKNYVEFE